MTSLYWNISGMTLLEDTIMITSLSAGMCAGYELSGQRKWTITEKLNGPFDLDLYRSDNGEQLLFITDPGKTGELLLKAVYISLNLFATVYVI